VRGFLVGSGGVGSLTGGGRQREWGAAVMAVTEMQKVCRCGDVTSSMQRVGLVLDPALATLQRDGRPESGAATELNSKHETPQRVGDSGRMRGLVLDLDTSMTSLGP